MKKILIFLTTSLLLHQAITEAVPKMTRMTRYDLKTKMRELWNDHGVWTREYIVSALSNSPSTDVAAKRILRNQDDIGNALIPFYGKEAGKELTDLLKEHILIAVDIVQAAKKNDKKGVAKHSAEWTENAKEISDFLSKANPHITKDAMFSMMKNHLALTGNEVTLRLHKEWDKDVENYDKVRAQLNHMADALSKALIAQFPKKFR